MGLLDTILHSGQPGSAEAGTPSAAGGQDVHPGLLAHVLDMMGGGGGAGRGAGSEGGIGGLLSKLRGGGLGSAVDSWVGNGPNQPVSGSEVQSALGHSHLNELAGKFGLSNDQVSSQLARILPALVNHVTPDGRVPDPASAQGMLGMLKGKLMGQA